MSLAKQWRRWRQMRKNRRVVKLIETWEASSYDESEWPRLKRVIDDNRLSARRRFRPPALIREETLAEIRRLRKRVQVQPADPAATDEGGA